MVEEDKVRFQSLEELMDHVEREAQKRVKKLSERYRDMVKNNSYDQVILEVLREADKPLSVDLVSFLTGISKSRCCKILKKLEKKWRIVKKVTVSKTGYYQVV